ETTRTVQVGTTHTLEIAVRSDNDIPRYPAGSGFMNRRDFLWQSGGGLGGIALAWLLQQDARAETSPYATKASHFTPKARRIIQIYSAGGGSHVDTFDHKPELARYDGKELTGKGKIDTFFGRPGRLLKSPFTF